MKVICLLLVLLVPLAAMACFQVGDIKVRFTFDGKPIISAPVSLCSHKKGTLARSSTDSNGWCVFKEIPDGEYKVALHSPSEETLSIIFRRTDTDKTAISVKFYGDYCPHVTVMRVNF